MRSVVTTLEQKVTFLQTTIEERTQETLTATSRLVRMLSLTHTHCSARARCSVITSSMVFGSPAATCSQPADKLQRECEATCHSLRAQLTESERARVRAQSELESANQRRKAAEAERRTTDEQLTEVKRQSYNQEQDIAQLKSLAGQLEGAREVAQERIRHIEAARDEYSSRLEAANESTRRAESSLRESRAEVSQLQAALAQLDEDRDNLQVSRGCHHPAPRPHAGAALLILSSCLCRPCCSANWTSKPRSLPPAERPRQGGTDALRRPPQAMKSSALPSMCTRRHWRSASVLLQSCQCSCRRHRHAPRRWCKCPLPRSRSWLQLLRTWPR